MAESTELRGEVVSRAAPQAKNRKGVSRLEKIKAAAPKWILWSFERGSWQYDVIVIAILAFIFFPFTWNRDRPAMQLTNLQHIQGIIEVRHTKTERVFQVDSRLVESLAPATPEQAVHVLLQRALKKPLTVKSTTAIHDKKNPDVILGYTVVTAEP